MAHVYEDAHRADASSFLWWHSATGTSLHTADAHPHRAPPHDPRSMNLDTEIVLIVQSPQLAAQFLDAFAIDFAPENAWRIVDVVGKDDVAWITQQPAKPLVEPHDPASVWRRFVRSIERILPIAPLL